MRKKLLSMTVLLFMAALGAAVDGVKEVVSSPQSTDGIYYDLNGRRVVKMQKGVYIVNGKKVGVE